MKPQRVVGAVLVVVGVCLLVVGINASNSLSDQVSNTFRGRFTDRTTWYIIGGIGLALLGLFIGFVRGRTIK